MKLVERLVRNYYEVYGSFDNIHDKLGELLKNHDISEDNLYEFIGYKSSKKLRAKECYDLRKSILKGEDIKDKEKKIKTLEKVDIEIPDISNSSMKHGTYIRLLSNYLKYSRSNVTENLDFREYINELSSNSLNVIAKTLNSKVFKDTASTMMPSWKYVEDVEPIIQLGVFYVPEKLSASDKKYIQENAIKSAILNTLDVNEEHVVAIRNVVTGQFTEMYESNYDAYRTICDIAMSYDISVKELLSICNFNVVNYVDQYIKHRCIFYLIEDNVRLTATNGKEDSTMLLAKKYFKRLYETGNLDYLTVHNGVIHLNRNKLIPLVEAL